MTTSPNNSHSYIPYTRLVTQESDEMSEHINHADIELIQLSRSKSPSSLTMVNFDLLDLQVGDYGASYISNGTTDTERSGLMFKLSMDFSTVCNGYDIDSKDFMSYSKNSEHIALHDGPCKWAYITFKSDHLQDSLIDCLDIDLDTRPGKSTHLQSQKQIYLGSLYRSINEVTELTQTNPEILKDPNILKGMESSLLNSQALLLANTSSTRTGSKDSTKKSHELIIKESIDFLEANSYEPIHVLNLCNVLNVKLRTLYYAFQEFYGISPIKYLRLVRYAKARRELIDSDPKKTSVSDIAARWHFWHFGRFSVGYKSLYGESPSETLHNKYRFI